MRKPYRNMRIALIVGCAVAAAVPVVETVARAQGPGFNFPPGLPILFQLAGTTQAPEPSTVNFSTGLSGSLSSGVLTVTASGSGGTVTSISQGTGITNTPNPIVATGTVAIDQSFAPTWTGLHTFSKAVTAQTSGSANTFASGASVAGDALTGTNSATPTLYNLSPTVNLAATGGTNNSGYTGILLNVTQTAIGSGTKKLLDLEVGSASKFYVDSTGAVPVVGDITLGNSATAIKTAAGVTVQMTSGSSGAANGYYLKASGAFNTSVFPLFEVDDNNPRLKLLALTGVTAMQFSAGGSTLLSIVALSNTVQFSDSTGGNGVTIQMAADNAGSLGAAASRIATSYINAAYTTEQQPSFSTTPTWNCASGEVISPAVATNNVTATLSTPSSPEPNCIIMFHQDGTGSRTLSLNGGSNELTGGITYAAGGANKIDRFDCAYSPGLAKWLCAFLGSY